MNHTWGYKINDHDWKSTEELLNFLVLSVSKGSNYLLNVGPDREGVIPEESVKRLTVIGNWLKRNGEAVYGAEAGPYDYDYKNIKMTVHGNTLYLFFQEWQGGLFKLHGLKSKALRTRLLNDTRISVPYAQSKITGIDVLEMKLPDQAPDEYISVIAIDLEEKPQVDKRILQQGDGTVALPMHLAMFNDENIRIHAAGYAQGFNNPKTSLNWKFELMESGTYRVNLKISLNRRYGLLNDAYRTYPVKVSIDGKSTSGKAGRINMDTTTPGDLRWHTAVSELGTIKIKKTGTLTATLGIGNPVDADATREGLQLTEVTLEKME
jgi:alpha-L-fucosidase